MFGTRGSLDLPDRKGDCEDFVLLKRRDLIDKGWPVGALLITVVRQQNGDGHAVLTVLTDRGDLVLDNLEPRVKLWSQTDYQYVKRQSEFDTGKWVAIDDARTTIGRQPGALSRHAEDTDRRQDSDFGTVCPYDFGPGRVPPPVPKIRSNRAGPRPGAGSLFSAAAVPRPSNRPSPCPHPLSSRGLPMLDAFTVPILDPEDRAAGPSPEAAAPADDGELLDAYSSAVSGVADTVGPAVVRVDTRRSRNGPAGGVGSGVIISPDGLILTNSHVVGGAGEIRLADSEGRTTEARLIGEDPDTDLALHPRHRRPRPARGRARRFQARCAAARSSSPSATRSASNRPSPPASSRRSAARSAPSAAA